MISLFIHITFFDVLDILLFAFILYKIYMLIRGSLAINIFIGIALIYLLWLSVRAFKMQLMEALLGQIMGVGMIALVIVFQQEIRRFLLLIGSKYFTINYRTRFLSLFKFQKKSKPILNFSSIEVSLKNLSDKKIGALFVIANKMSLDNYSHIGDTLNAHISSRLIESIFTKDSPLHDGAILIHNNKIVSARCILPISDRVDLPPHYGTRHRAALGMSEFTDSFIIVVSEENGAISFAHNGNLYYDVSIHDIKKALEEEFSLI
ncbi:MAG: diadenylate cyclase CdaA [Bacteroidales bacterium]|nr:diadenylate cyclase CdaA [Bacteroidales bacterium]